MAIKLDYAVQESVTNMRRNLFMSFAAVLVVTISLFLFGGFFLLRNALTRTANLLTDQVRVTVFLDGSVSSSDREAIQQDLLAMDEVQTVTYEDKKQAYEKFKELFANEPALVENTSPDALPESFRVRLKDPRTFTVVKDRLEGRPGVLEIKDEREVVEQLFAATRVVRTAAFVIALGVGLAAMVLIATTIRMAIYARRKEVGIMKLVGATNWFIRIPFMMEGVVQGVFGAVAALVLLAAVKPLFHVFNPAGGFGFSYGLQVTWLDLGVHGLYLLFTGALVGALGSLLGLRKFLDV
jgi:cell division transport system permease protein